MAKLGAFINVSQIRGKLGGQVFTKGRSGAVLRVRVRPSNPRSTSQTATRAYLAAASRAAKALNSTNLALWKAYALTITKHNPVSGSAYNPSWITAFNSLYVPYKIGTPGGTPPSTPPTSPYTGDTISLTAVGASGQVTYTGSAQQTTGNQTIFLLQKLKSANRTPAPKGYRELKVAAIPATPFQSSVTGLAVGTYAVGYKYLLTATGQESLPVYLGNVTVS